MRYPRSCPPTSRSSSANWLERHHRETTRPPVPGRTLLRECSRDSGGAVLSETRELEVFPFPGSSYRSPDARWSRLREEQPVVKVRTEGGVDAWLITRYEDVRNLSADPRLSRAAA